MSIGQYYPPRVRAKKFLKSLLPQKLFSLVQSVWVHTFAHFTKGQDILGKYTAIFLKHNERVVQAGPFKGMNYVSQAIGSSYLHKLIGSYEAILHPIIEKISKNNYTTILDIGSAEGYYLVGFGRMFKDAQLVGFEIEVEGRELTKEMYTLNNLSNKLTLLGEATAENISTYIEGDTLLICDCEGGELDILSVEKAPKLQEVHTAIIELHDFIRPGIKEALIKRFEKTHTITIIPFELANPELFPFFRTVSSKEDLYELRRERGWQEQEWMILEKK